MDDLASKLGELLNNPGSLDQIKSIAGLLGGAASSPQPSSPQPEQSNSVPGVDGEMLQTIMKVAPLLSSFKQEDDNTRLLHALRPLLCEERQKKLDEAIKLMQMMRLLPLLKGSDLLSGLFGG